MYNISMSYYNVIEAFESVLNRLAQESKLLNKYISIHISYCLAILEL